jgi:hypothetical protein
MANQTDNRLLHLFHVIPWKGRRGSFILAAAIGAVAVSAASYGIMRLVPTMASAQPAVNTATQAAGTINNNGPVYNAPVNIGRIVSLDPHNPSIREWLSRPQPPLPPWPWPAPWELSKEEKKIDAYFKKNCPPNTKLFIGHSHAAGALEAGIKNETNNGICILDSDIEGGKNGIEMSKPKK